MGSAILSGISNGRRDEAFALAIDDAAARLAEEIFRWASTPTPPPTP